MPLPCLYPASASTLPLLCPALPLPQTWIEVWHKLWRRLAAQGGPVDACKEGVPLELPQVPGACRRGRQRGRLRSSEGWV